MPLLALPSEIKEKLDVIGLGVLTTHSFAIDIAGEPLANAIVGGFQQVKGLDLKSRVISIKEGGHEGTHKFPAEDENRPVTLSRGLSASRFLFNWRNAVKTWQPGKPRYDRDVTVYHLHHIGGGIAFEVWAWILRNAWPSDWSGSPYDANVTQQAIESITLEHAGIVEQVSVLSGLAGDVIGAFQT